MNRSKIGRSEPVVQLVSTLVSQSLQTCLNSGARQVLVFCYEKDKIKNSLGGKDLFGVYV